MSQLILKYLVSLPVDIFWLFRTYNRIQPHLFISIFMNGYWTVMEAFVCQINGHASVSVHSIVLVVNFSDLRLYLRFLSIVIRLPVFSVVINKHSGKYSTDAAASAAQNLFDIFQQTDKPLIDFFCKECRCFF